MKTISKLILLALCCSLSFYSFGQQDSWLYNNSDSLQIATKPNLLQNYQLYNSNNGQQATKIQPLTLNLTKLAPTQEMTIGETGVTDPTNQTTYHIRIKKPDMNQVIEMPTKLVKE